LLIQRTPFLRADLGLDFTFTVVYSAFFVSLALVLKRWVAGQPLQDNVATVVNVATAALLITGVLDVAENAHILAMLSMAEQGQSIGQSEIAGQMVESQIKFMFSYFGVFVLSFALPQSTIIERLTVFVFRWLQLPVSGRRRNSRPAARAGASAVHLARNILLSLACGRRPGSSHVVPGRCRECCVAALQTLLSSPTWCLTASFAYNNVSTPTEPREVGAIEARTCPHFSSFLHDCQCFYVAPY
jgi:hypothetical protein